MSELTFHKGTESGVSSLFRTAKRLNFANPLIRTEPMPARSALLRVPRTVPKTAPEPAPETKTRLFHARMLVTRVEEWCVEAETEEQARALLAAGAGHRCTPGESIQVEIDSLLDD